jgi:UDP-GlcNAc3NAcA epimerase
MRCMTVVGTRPEFIQIAPLTKGLRRRGHYEILVNTDQHYDDNMSRAFFRDLNLPEPDISLEVGSGSHAQQTGEIMIRLEKVMLSEKPDWVVVYGDTNSTLAGAIVAAKLHIPIAHVEAGLRSFDREMPEEVNRIVTDHISDLLFAPTQTAANNLMHEGITKGVHQVGDVRVDVLAEMTLRTSEKLPALLQQTRLTAGEPFALATIHRASNTDDAERLKHIVEAFDGLGLPVVLPVHPRLHKMMQTFGYTFGDAVRVIDPIGFLDMVTLLNACEVVITDSGGLQKEAYMLRRPAVTVRDSTEWVETVEAGWNRLCEPVPELFKSAVAQACAKQPAEHPDFYGTRGVSERMIDLLENHESKII